MKQHSLPPTAKFLLILVFIIAISDVVKAASNRGVKAVILYTYDDASSGSSVVTMEVDKDRFMSVIQDTQSNVKDARPLKFVQNNGFFDLLEGDSSQFSFMTTSGMADCDCKCSRRPIITTRTTTTTTTTRRPECPNGSHLRLPYCCENFANNERCELPTRPTRPAPPPPFVSKKDVAVSTGAPTYLPPATTTPRSPCPLGGSGKYCCPDGSEYSPLCERPKQEATTTQRPVCANGARYKLPYCCENFAENPTCELATRPQVISTTRKPECANGARYKLPYCCENFAENPTCELATRPQVISTTRKPECANGARYKLPYCCENFAENPTCELPTRPQVISTTRKPECANGARYKLPYCCENFAENPTCELPTRPTTPRPVPFTTKKVFKGPTYLPVARVTTERPATTTQTYTYGSRPTFTYRFSFTNGAWTYVPRSTSHTTRVTSTTAKYAYDQPINGINYSGADNSL